MLQPITLYHYYRSSCSWRVRWGLRLKQISAELIPVNLLNNEQRESWYLEKNPSGQVPCLEVGGQSYSESMAILEWLEEVCPSPALLPQDPLARMRVRGLCYVITSGTQPLQNLAAQRYFSADREKQLAYARHWVHEGLKSFETMIRRNGTAGTFSFGGEITLADLCLVPQCYNAERFGVELARYPTIERIYRHCRETEACRETAPERFAPAP
jgi:maleylacetoacetate isomerase